MGSQPTVTQAQCRDRWSTPGAGLKTFGCFEGKDSVDDPHPISAKLPLGFPGYTPTSPCFWELPVCRCCACLYTSELAIMATSFLCHAHRLPSTTWNTAQSKADNCPLREPKQRQEQTAGERGHFSPPQPTPLLSGAPQSGCPPDPGLGGTLGG